MSSAATSQLFGLALIVVLMGFGMQRRLRPQPVRPQRIAVTGAIIVVVLGISLVGTGGRIIGDPVATALVPVFLAAGAALGYVLVRTMTFWTDPGTGQLWMRGGALFAAILLGTIVLRFGFRAVVYGSPFGPAQPGGGGLGGGSGLLYDLSADLLFLSLGLWAARAILLVQRHRAHMAAQPAGPR
jgi:hypothetical protein